MTIINELGAPRAAIVGTGRSGTGYMSRLITEATTHTGCGHESWWCELGGQTPGYEVDASWLALPHIEAGEWSGPVVHVVRDPVRTVASLLRTEFFGAHSMTPYPQYALRHCEPAASAMSLSPVAAAVEFWAHWNARCAAIAQLTVRLEDVANWEGGPDSIAAATLDLIADVLGVTFGAWETAAAIPTNVNHRNHPSGNNDLVIAVDEAYVWDRLGERGLAFGYGRP
jgi:hypothetical protein